MIDVIQLSSGYYAQLPSKDIAEPTEQDKAWPDFNQAMIQRYGKNWQQDQENEDL